MYVLGIETTCDETACSVVKDGKEILSNVIASQHDIHSLYGGVFPELACRRHVDVIIPVVREALSQAKVSFNDIDLIAVAKGPGLIGALVIGMNTAKGLAFGSKKPLVGVNHVEAHLYAAMMSCENPVFPAIGVVISGGHTFLAHVSDLGTYELIGSTIDDAVGEAFDKVASMLKLPYPGGPKVEELAKTVSKSSYFFKTPMVKNSPWDFSFSGLKTNVLYTIQKKENLTEQDKAEIAFSFQETALQTIVDKTKKACLSFDAKAIYVGGGVSNNKRLRQLFQESSLNIPVYFPPKDLSLDNGAMIAGLGYHQYTKQGSDPLDLEPQARIPLQEKATFV